MRVTVQVKLFIILVSVVLLFIAISQLLSFFFLDKFFMKKKEGELLQALTTLTSIIASGEDDVQNQITEFSQRSNVFISLVDERFENMYSLMPIVRETSPSPFGNRKTQPNIGNQYYNSRMRAIVDTHFPNFSNKPSFATMYTNARHDDGFMMLLANVTFANGETGYALLQTSVPAINLSVSVMTEFIWTISAVILAIGTPCVFFLARSFTKPIVQISEAAKKITNLDFSHKLQISQNDEIGDLATNVAIMSQKLSHTIQQLTLANTELSRNLEIKEKAEILRKEFVANVSHELKTPISIIGGYAEGLKLNVDTEEREYYCDVIIDESSKMNKLVVDILDLSQIESGFTKMDLDIFDLSSLLQTAERYFPACKDKEITLTILESPETLSYTDGFRLEQVFSNYMMNAINHTPSCGEIRVYITQSATEAMVSVSNSGSHIPETELEKIWLSFYKADKARTRQYGGQGLGLYIAKTIMDALGGTCQAVNLDDGVVFSFAVKKWERVVGSGE
ncbi:MAG: HAMP domain-containing histidine kinase [Clostridiales bacterium]|nr:HAMP domain-containing histidine kinase [Clostridiales bacterium]